MKIGFIFHFLWYSLALFLSNCSHVNRETPQNEKIIGVKIYEHSGDYHELFADFKNIGINTIFGSVKLLSDNKFKVLAKEKGIKTFGILPIYYAPEELESDSSLFAITQYGKPAVAEWVKFACPSNEKFNNAKINFIKDFVSTNQPTGISLDFIRHFAYWEKIYPETVSDSLPNTCFDTRCISRFCTEINNILPDSVISTFEIYKWIRENHFEGWVQWKSDLITSMVEKIVTEVKTIDPEIIVNLHAVPWRENDFDSAIKNIVGQDFKSLSKHVDYISPMTYSHMVRREPEWISAVVKDIHDNSQAKIIPSIQVGIAYLSDTLSSKEFKQCLTESLKAPSHGVIFWNWNALYSDKEKLEIVKRRFNK